MKSLDQWLNEYESSHLNRTNRLIHKICVPAIFLSIVGMLWYVRKDGWMPVINLGTVLSVPVLAFYFRLGRKTFSMMLGVFLLSFLICAIAEVSGARWWWHLLLFIVAWIGQFVGHKIEGKKPSFFEDLQFLLIGPIWTLRR